MIVNAHKLYKDLNKNDDKKSKITSRKFREDLLSEWHKEIFDDEVDIFFSTTLSQKNPHQLALRHYIINPKEFE